MVMFLIMLFNVFKAHNWDNMVATIKLQEM